MIVGVLLHRGLAEERGEGLLRDQHADGRNLHEGGVRPGEAGRLRPGGGGARRSPVGAAQLRQSAQLR